MKYPEIKARIIDIYPDDEQIKELVGKSLLLFCNDKLSTKFVARFIPASRKCDLLRNHLKIVGYPLGAIWEPKLRKVPINYEKLKKVKP